MSELVTSFRKRSKAVQLVQRVNKATSGVVNPANVETNAGGLAAFVGAGDLTNWRGIAISALGFIADLFDGPTARFFGVDGPLGEFFDHTWDKAKLARAAPNMWRHGLAPKSLIGAVALRQSVNATATLYDRATNSPHRISKPTKRAKRAFFMEEVGLGLNVIGTKLAETHPKAGRAMKVAGTMLGWSGVAYGLQPTAELLQTSGLVQFGSLPVVQPPKVHHIGHYQPEA